MSNVRDFGARGDGRTDDTAAIQHCLEDGNGTVELPRGTYLLSKPLVVDLTRQSRFSLDGSGGTAKLVMTASGPAIHLLGSHKGTAAPKDFPPEIWLNERMPTLQNIEIEGRHPEADGVLIEGVMQPTLMGVLIRQVRTGVRASKRARNILISHCHIYHNTGIGVHLDQVNLHQINIIGSHISYNRLGGIRIEASEIRNLQITGNDIEYNNSGAFSVPGQEDLPTAEIYIDVGTGSVREGTIASNTIQATYSKNGANIRFVGQGAEASHKAGMWSIAGNLVGSQEINVHLQSVRGLILSGNFIYSGHKRNLLVENSRHLILGDCCFEHNPDYKDLELCTGVTFRDCENVVINGMILQDAQAGKHTVKEAVPIQREGLLELIRCHCVTLSGSQILEGSPYGVYLEDCTDTVITGCTILDSRQKKQMKHAIRWKGKTTGSLVTSSRIGAGSDGALLHEQPLATAYLIQDSK